jgi:hypothetical protein
MAHVYGAELRNLPAAFMMFVLMMTMMGGWTDLSNESFF